MLVSKYTNEPISAVKQMSTGDLLSYASLAIAQELAGSDMPLAEKMELAEDKIFGTDYSGRRDLRAIMRKAQNKAGGIR